METIEELSDGLSELRVEILVLRDVIASLIASHPVPEDIRRALVEAREKCIATVSEEPIGEAEISRIRDLFGGYLANARALDRP